MAPTSKAATSDKKKAKKSSRSGADSSSRSKDKERKSRDKTRKSSSKKKESAAPAQPAPVVAPPVVHDPDAIQLFRRYDRNRSGVLTRLDFLQLLRDYADPTGSGWGASVSRPPLSLTDTSGIPLGYQRADRNSEFEAGQLFERYDKDHSGALTLETFHVFFADFKPQLRAFVEESNYRALAPASVTIAPVLPQAVQEEETGSAPAKVAATGEDIAVQNPKAIRAQYRAALWKLRSICKNELFDQRGDIVRQMKVARDRMASQQRQSSRNERWGDPRGGKRRPRASAFPDFDGDDMFGEGGGDASAGNDSTERYEALEDDLDRLDELMRYVRRYLNKGSAVTRREMQEFIEQADGIEEEAQNLAMKDYGDMEHQSEPKKEKENSPPPTHTLSSAPGQPAFLPSSKQSDLERLLRVKDQMIYQLLQERTSMRKERSAVEESLQRLSEVSAREMKKWARLTDDMQAEIEQLRSQLRLQQRRDMA